MGEVIALYAAAILGCLIGFGTLLHFTYIAFFWKKARACVVDNSGERSAAASVSNEAFSGVYFAIFEFTDEHGIKHQAKGDIGKKEPWQIGQQVSLLYNPKRPKHALSMNLLQRLIFSGVFIAIGVISSYLLATQTA